MLTVTLFFFTIYIFCTSFLLLLSLSFSLISNPYMLVSQHIGQPRNDPCCHSLDLPPQTTLPHQRTSTPTTTTTTTTIADANSDKPLNSSNQHCSWWWYQCISQCNECEHVRHHRYRPPTRPPYPRLYESFSTHTCDNERKQRSKRNDHDTWNHTGAFASSYGCYCRR